MQELDSIYKDTTTLVVEIHNHIPIVQFYATWQI